MSIKDRHARTAPRMPRARLAALGIVAILAAACASPGAVATPTPAPSASEAAPSTSAGTELPSASSAAAGPDCGTDPVTLSAYFETGFDIPFKLSEEFTKQYPNVTWDIKQDQFTNLMTATPRLLSGDNPPDLIRLPSMVSLVKDGLLKNLDEYATAFGWDNWSAAQLAQNRVAEDGTRGSGSLYAMGLNYSMTGVFYSKKLAEQIGMTQPPATVAEFEELLKKAKDAGLQPIMAVERNRERWRSRLPAPEPHGRLRTDRAHQRMDLPEAGYDDRHANQPHGRAAPPALGRCRLLPEGRQRDRVHRRQRPVRQGRGRVHVQR